MFSPIKDEIRIKKDPVEYKIDANIGFIRIIFETWKLSYDMAQYKKFSIDELIQMHNQSNFQDGKTNEPFGLIFEVDRLKLIKSKEIDLQFYNLDIFTYQIIVSVSINQQDSEKKVTIN